VRGVCDATVVSKTFSKTLVAQKVFSPPTRDIGVLRSWFAVLAQELAQRYALFTRQFEVTGHSLNVKLGTGGLTSSGDFLNKTTPFGPIFSLVSMLNAALRIANPAIRGASESPGPLLNCVTLTIADMRQAGSENAARAASTQLTLFQAMKPRHKHRANGEEPADGDHGQSRKRARPGRSLARRSGDCGVVKERTFVVVSEDSGTEGDDVVIIE
jgi:hypothetical protein